MTDDAHAHDADCPPATPGGHAHHHADDAHTHAHASGDDAVSQRRILQASLLTFGFMLVEVIGAVYSGSLALLADAAHMLTDAGSLALAWIGFRLAERPADAQRSYGWARMKILAAFTNGLLLVLLALWIIWEAVERLLAPSPVMGGVMVWFAVGGLIVNLVSFRILDGGGHGHDHDLNLRGAVWHVLGDLLGSVAAIIAALIIITTGWMPADPLLSILVALIAGWAGVRIARAAAHILLEGAPPGFDAVKIRADLMAEVDGISDVRHIHAWTLTEDRPLLTLDVVAKENADAETLRRAVKTRLDHAFHFAHVTVEIIGTPLPKP